METHIRDDVCRPTGDGQEARMGGEHKSNPGMHVLETVKYSQRDTP